MAKKRKAYAPFSLTSEAGVGQTPVEGYIDVDQQIYPTVSTGTVNENGKWVGVKASDSEFIGFTKDELIADGSGILVPTGAKENDNKIDMTGYTDLFIALKPTRTGNYRFAAVMAPDTIPFANLSPTNAGNELRGNIAQSAPADFEFLFLDSAESCAADIWNIFIIGSVLREQKNLQISITNNSGGESTMEFAYMRLL
jgi:hypothetical protein